MVCNWICALIFWVGFIRLMTIVVAIAKYLANYFKAGLDLTKRYGPNSWVAITGGANGIGRSMAKDFAKKGFNIFIWDNDKKAIDEVEEILKDINSSVEVRTMHKDLSDGKDLAFYQDLYDDIKDLDVSILVNNVGIGSFKRFEQQTPEYISKTIKLNSTLTAVLTSLMVKKLKSRGKRSAIINLSSGAGNMPIPYELTYCASKAFSKFFSLGISHELKDNIDVLVLCPGFVHTNFVGTKKFPDGVEPDDFARYAIKNLGKVDEISGSILQDTITYGLVKPIFYSSFSLYHNFLIPKFKPIFDELLVATNYK